MSSCTRSGASVPARPKTRTRPTVRLRLTLLYGFCFLLSGTALLGIIYALVNTRLSHLQLSTGGSPDNLSPDHAHATSTVADSLRAQRAADLHQLLVLSGLALAIMAAASVGLGWLLTGRTLRPLREITTATRTISERNLHERLAHLDGRCARYRWPHRFVFWDALPRSGYGKVVKKELRERLFASGELWESTSPAKTRGTSRA